MIAETIDIDDDLIADFFLALDRPQYSLGAPTYRARLMKERIEDAAARQRERVQRLQRFFHPIHFCFELLGLAVADFVHAFVLAVGRRREFRTDIEKLVLDSAQHLGVPTEILAETIFVVRQKSAHDSYD